MKAWFTNSSGVNAAPGVADAAPAMADAAPAMAADALPPGVPRPAAGSKNASLAACFDYKSDIRLGYGLIAFIMVLMFAVAGTVPLSSAAIAPGVVGVAGQKKSIQHLEGGIVSNIHVSDGDLVTAGQTLVELNDVQPRAAYEELRIRLVQAKAELLRWHAEQQGKSDIDTGQWVRVYADDPTFLTAIQTQQEVMRSRLTVFNEKLANFSHQIAQAKEQINGRMARIANLRKQLHLVDAELDEYLRLKESGMTTRKQLFDLRQERAQIDVQLDDSVSTMAVAKQLVAQFDSQILELRGMRMQESAENLDRLRDEIGQLEQQGAAAGNQLQRVVIKSPISGFVVNSIVHTTGGVVTPGQVIMEIIPTNEALIIDVKVDPKDRNSLQVGQDAEIRFNAFDRRNTEPVKGKVTVISADRLLDPVAQTPYYKTSIALTEDPSVKLGGAVLHPGMQAEAVIVTGDRTVLSYLVAPLTRSLNRAFREE